MFLIIILKSSTNYDDITNPTIDAAAAAETIISTVLLTFGKIPSKWFRKLNDMANRAGKETAVEHFVKCLQQ